MLQIKHRPKGTLSVEADKDEPWLRFSFAKSEARINSFSGERDISLSKVKRLVVKTEAPGACLEIEKCAASDHPARIQVQSSHYAVVFADRSEISSVRSNSGANVLVTQNSKKPDSLGSIEITSFNFSFRSMESTCDHIKQKIFNLLAYVLTKESLRIHNFGRSLKAWWNDTSLFQSIDSLWTSQHKFEISNSQIAEIKRVIKAGDILLRSKNGYPLDRLFVGHFQHAGICVEENGTVLEAVGGGVRLENLDNFCRADSLLIFRPYISATGRTHMINYALGQLGKAYNYSFNRALDRHYCSGLVYRALRAGYGGVETQKVGSPIHPDDLLKVTPYELVWSNKEP